MKSYLGFISLFETNLYKQFQALQDVLIIDKL